MAVIDADQTRPALVSAVAALALHAAIVAGLPHRPSGRGSDRWSSRPVEVDLSQPQAQPQPVRLPPPPPPETAPAPSPKLESHAVPRAPVAVPRSESPSAPAPEAPSRAGPDDLDPHGEVPAGMGSGPSGPPGPPALPGPPASASSPGPFVPAPPPPPAIDRSRPPALARGGQWSCPWPDAAEQIDEAVVVVRVVVDATGHATRVDVVADPGYGFGREAKRCAMRELYVPALDREGRIIAAESKPIRIRFSR